MGAEVGNKVFEKKHPGAAYLGSGRLTRLRAPAQFLWMYPQERGCLAKAHSYRGRTARRAGRRAAGHGLPR